MEVKISVIIPCYNVKKELLFQCIDSILKQDFQDYEIILVNDGSDKQYEKSIQEATNLDSRIVVINQDNQGLSAARNSGMRHAVGNYITFIDPDDMIVPYFFSEAYYIAEKKNADYVVGCVYHTSSRNPEISRYSNPRYTTKETGEYRPFLINIKQRFSDGSYFSRGVVARLIRRSILEDIFFQEDVRFAEDIIWNLDVMSKCNKVYMVHQIWYIYWENPVSITRKYNPDIVALCEKHLDALLQRIDRNNTKEMTAYCHHIHELLNDYVFGSYYGRAECKMPIYMRYISFCKLCQREPWSLFVTFFSNNKCDWKTKAECFLIKFNLIYWVYYIQEFVGKLRK